MPPPTPSTTAGREDDRAGSVHVASWLVSDALRAVGSSPLGESPPASPASWLAMGSRLRFDWLGGQQACFDLAQSDRQRLLVDMRLDERADVLEQALAELAV